MCIEIGTKSESWAPGFPSEQIGGRDIGKDGELGEHFTKVQSLLQEVVTELNSSSSNSEAIAPRPTVTCTGAGSQVSDSIHNEHRRLLWFHYQQRRTTATKSVKS